MFRYFACIACCCLMAATSSGAAQELPQVLHVGTVAPDVILVKIRAQRVEFGKQIPYEKKEGDVVNEGQSRFVTRDGKMLGALAGAEGKILFTAEKLVGEPLDVEWAVNPESYQIVSSDSKTIAPRQINRKTRLYQYRRTADVHDAAKDHFLYLVLPEPLEKGKTYTLQFNNGKLATASAEFSYDSTKLPSDAVHVSQIGFRPDDPVKVAFLSCWMGDGGGLSYKDGLSFSLIDEKSGQAVFEGKAHLTKPAKEGDGGNAENYQMTDVHEMDFSAFATPGTYRVSVEGIGCSLPFPIGEDVWTKAFYTSVRGLFHQRSGIALGPPYTPFVRPRGFHPDDGVKVYHTNYAPGPDGTGGGGGFKAIVAGKTDEIVPNAWGGYMDAGDWDRRPIHMYVPRLLLDLYDMAPEKLDTMSLNLPESDNKLPDLLDEAMWLIDFHMRTQTPDGGIRPGIESAEHPRRGEGSWQESLTVMAYAPTANMSYKFAAAAAHAALVLRDKDPERAKKVEASAFKAFEWADQQKAKKVNESKNGNQASKATKAKAKKGKKGASLPASDPAARMHPNNEQGATNMDGERVLAAAEFFRLTGDEKWHGIYQTESRFRNANAVYNGHKTNSGIYDPQDEAGWVYMNTDRPGMNETIKANFQKALLAHADARLADIDDTGFRWVATKGKIISYSASVIPDAVALVRAHYLTKDEKYLRGIVLATQHGAGANPLNLCYTTGVGINYQQRMVHEDFYVSGQPLPPGMTVNGPFNPRGDIAGNWVAGVKSFQAHNYPEAEKWPTLESYYDIGFFSPMSEFTIHRNIAPNAYVWGYLALGR